ncbi:MAG: hypothetical protein LBP53_08835 [Candidatus Peribacteria bacterium]|nr:hypothetical protein [Candidatus Peribacteria bacterium]
MIFVLLASSLIALLAMHQIRNLMTYGATTYNYFRAHYLARAGLELALTETHLRDAGFQMGAKQGIASGDAIVSENVWSEYEAFAPYFTVHMEARKKEYRKDLTPGESIVIPLFLDNKELGHSGWLTGVKAEELEKYTQNISLTNEKNADLFFGIFAFSGEQSDEMVGMVSKTGKTLATFLGDGEVKAVLANTALRKYLTIVNPTSNPTVSITLTATSQPFAIADTHINVQAHYGDTDVGLEAIYTEPFPNFLQGVMGSESSTP